MYIAYIHCGCRTPSNCCTYFSAFNLIIAVNADNNNEKAPRKINYLHSVPETISPDRWFQQPQFWPIKSSLELYKRLHKIEKRFCMAILWGHSYRHRIKLIVVNPYVLFAEMRIWPSIWQLLLYSVDRCSRSVSILSPFGMCRFRLILNLCLNWYWFHFDSTTSTFKTLHQIPANCFSTVKARKTTVSLIVITVHFTTLTKSVFRKQKLKYPRCFSRFLENFTCAFLWLMAKMKLQTWNNSRHSHKKTSWCRFKSMLLTILDHRCTHCCFLFSLEWRRRVICACLFGFVYLHTI